MWKDILVYAPFDTPKLAESAVGYAAALAAGADAHLSVLSLAIEMPMPNVPDIGGIREAIDQRRRDFRAEVGTFADERCRQAAKAGSKVEALSTLVMSGSLDDVFASYARLHDLTVVGGSRGESAAEAVLNAALFASGRPLIRVPGEAAVRFGLNRIMVAWDGGVASSRAVADAMPALRRAKLVQVVRITDDARAEAHVPSIDLARHLTRNGVKVEVHDASRDGLSIGRALLREADRMEADLMVMGGYGHSRLRETILGGATRSILEEARIPVLMSHA